jgi:hypothetical protein
MDLQSVFAESDRVGASSSSGVSARQANAQLTYVELVFYRHRVGRWLRFGEVADERFISRRTRFVGFAPGAVFALVRWVSNGRGGGVSRLDILQAVGRSAPCSTVPGVTPGAEILLRLSGWPRVREALEAIAALEALGVDPADAAPDDWRRVSQRLSVGEAASSNTLGRHAAWLARRELAP